jgi:hypothetical protein
VTCGAATDVDLNGKAFSPLSAATFPGGKYAVTWGEGAGTGAPSLHTRFWDGAAWKAERAFTNDVSIGDGRALLAFDGTGRLFAHWLANGAGNMRRAVMAADGTWGADEVGPGIVGETFTLTGTPTTAWGLFSTGGNVTSSSYDPANGTWSAPEARRVGASPYSQVTLAWNGAKGSMLAFQPGLNSAGQMSVATYDGAAWSATATQAMGVGGPLSGTYDARVATYANGDALVVWSESHDATQQVWAVRYRAANAAFGAPQKLFEAATGTMGGGLSLFIDAADHVTALFMHFVTGENRVMALRDVGAGFSVATQLGVSYGRVIAAMDPASGAVAVEVGYAQGTPLSVVRVGAASTTWEAPVATPFDSLTGAGDGAIAFKSGSQPVIFRLTGPSSRHLSRSICE